jgi:hypothetical protein
MGFIFFTAAWPPGGCLVAMDSPWLRHRFDMDSSHVAETRTLFSLLFVVRLSAVDEALNHVMDFLVNLDDCPANELQLGGINQMLPLQFLLDIRDGNGGLTA